MTETERQCRENRHRTTQRKNTMTENDKDTHIILGVIVRGVLSSSKTNSY